MIAAWVCENRRVGNFVAGLPILLFLDGHISRDCAQAIQLFAAHNIITVTFPSQLTHVMQPVDIGIGGPFRHFFRRSLRRMKLRWKERAAPGQKLTVAEKRGMVVAAGVDAAQQATPKSSREAAFAAAGLCPYNPKTPCASPYVQQDQDAPKHPEGRTTGRDKVSAKILTSPTVLSTLTQ
jgi:hypothetical protein